MKFAVVSTWPTIKNAEYEIVERLKIAAKRIGHSCIVVDGDGKTLDRSNRYITSNDVDFCISLHFLTPKLFDIYTYGAMWNPPQFLQDWDYQQMIKHILSYDDYLTYNSRAIIEHLANLLTYSRKTLQGALELFPSIPGDVFTPTLGMKKVFYSGINWERLGNKKGRHHDLFMLLDKSGYMRLYGPEKFLGQRPWAGFTSFKGSLPFDGLSTIKEINKCGISLVITSDIHRNAEAVTNRLYESCAAGAVIISDDNLFTVREFGDSVLTFKYYDDAESNYQQIIEKIKWIDENPEKALAMARKSQAIYLEKYDLENTLNNLMANHSKRQAELFARLHAKNTLEAIDIIITEPEFDKRLTKDYIEVALKTINKQSYQNLRLIISVADYSDEEIANLKAILQNVARSGINYQVVNYLTELNIPKEFKQPATAGELVYNALQATTGSFFILFNFNTEWDVHHLTKLKRVLEDNAKAYAAYSAYISRSQKTQHIYNIDIHNQLNWRNITPDSIIDFVHTLPAFVLLFRREVINDISMINMRKLNGFDHYYISSLFLIIALKMGEVNFTQAVTALCYEITEFLDEVNICENRVKQIQHLTDMFMLDAWYQNMRVLYLSQKLDAEEQAASEGDHKQEFATFKRRLKNYLMADFGHHKFLVRTIQRFYRLLRKS